MFKKARLKLTTWYLLIIMTISLSFSGVIFRSVTREFQRRLNLIERRLDLRGRGFNPPVGQTRFFIQDIKESRQKVLFILLYTNGVIFAFSALAGYFLAGKTLSPIEEVVEEQKRFVADASHELKTPLTALQTSIEVALRDKKLKLKDSKKILKESLEDIDSLKKLTNSLLSLARYQQDNNFTKERLDLKDVIENVYKKISPLAKKKKIQLKIKTKSVKISANKESLEKLITILLDNAVKYTPKNGKVTLEISKNKRYLKLKVKDTGIGIPERDIPYIFDRFYRADKSRSKLNLAGFGLGLSMAKRIVEMHNGSIKAKSSPKKGSTFTVKLPIF
jgi:two-component system sensor histidine kinase CiaH